MNQDVVDALKKAAKIARSNAYAPYSGFTVGAAVEGVSGKIYSGCNVENASFGLTVCAERCAIFAAASAGERCLSRLLVLTDAEHPATPCGACRQVMHEFNVKEVFLCNLQGKLQTFSLDELLPQAFGPENLKGASSRE